LGTSPSVCYQEGQRQTGGGKATGKDQKSAKADNAKKEAPKAEREAEEMRREFRKAAAQHKPIISKGPKVDSKKQKKQGIFRMVDNNSQRPENESNTRTEVLARDEPDQSAIREDDNAPFREGGMLELERLMQQHFPEVMEGGS
jgi:hypothetical protein